MFRPIEYKALTRREQVLYDQMKKYRDILVKEFDASSQSKGLKVKRKT